MRIPGMGIAAQQMVCHALFQQYPSLQPLECKEKNLQETLDGTGWNGVSHLWEISNLTNWRFKSIASQTWLENLPCVDDLPISRPHSRILQLFP